MPEIIVIIFFVYISHPDLLTTAKLDAASHIWLSALSTHAFKMQYQAGKQNLDAGALSSVICQYRKIKT